MWPCVYVSMRPLMATANDPAIFLNHRTKMPSRKKAKGAFRVARKAFGLTFSCPRKGECRNLPEGEHQPTCSCDHPIQTHRHVLEMLDAKGPHQYIVGKEAHASGKTHWHVYVKYDSIVDSVDPRVFDCMGVHPNIVDGAPGKGWQAYCTKDGDFETNFFRKDTDAYKQAIQCETADEAIEMLWQTRPEDMCKQGDRIAENLRARLGVKHEQKRFSGPFPSEFYPQGWDPETHSLLIVGPPGLGKTQFARYLLGECDYIRGDLEPLKACKFDKPLLFDEVEMLQHHPEQSKEITDVQDGGTIKMRYKNLQLPPGIKRIFVHNIEHPFRNPSGAVYGRRVHTHVINGPCAAAARAAALAAAAHASAAAAHASAAAAHASSLATTHGPPSTTSWPHPKRSILDPSKPCGCGTWTSCHECDDE